MILNKINCDVTGTQPSTSGGRSREIGKESSEQRLLRHCSAKLVELLAISKLFKQNKFKRIGNGIFKRLYIYLINMYIIVYTLLILLNLHYLKFYH